MQMTDTVKKILANYEGENPGVKGNLARMLMTGKLAGTGKMIILPVDQGFEHGPARSFAKNVAGYDPHYHYQLAIDAGLNAYAAPLGMIEAGADTFAGQIPTILKCNSANSLMSDTAGKNQAVTATGRLSSSDPNLQNIPIRTEDGRRIRRAFVAPPGRKLVACDYSQIELRIMAHLSGDPGLIGAFESGVDVHRATAAEVFARAIDEVTANERRAAKAINFGLMYGMSAFGQGTGLIEEDGVDGAHALQRQTFLDEYPRLCGLLGRDRNDQWDSQTEGVGASDDEHGNGAHHGVAWAPDNGPDHRSNEGCD